MRTFAESVSLPHAVETFGFAEVWWIVEDETDEEVTNQQIARLLKTFLEELDSSKK